MPEPIFASALETALRMRGVDPDEVGCTHYTAELPPEEEQGELTETERAALAALGREV